MSYSDEVMADSPLVYWKLDEASGNFVDTAGTAAAAVPLGDPYDYAQSPLITQRTSIFNDTNSRASTATDVSLDDWNEWTLEAWIKMSARAGASADGIIEFGTNGPELRVEQSDGRVRLVKSHVADDGFSTITVNDNQPHHIVARRTGGVSTIWIDGVNRTGTMANPTYANVVADSLGFGASWGTGTTPASPDTDSEFRGYLDEIAIYNGALTDARVIAHYQAGIAQTVPQRLQPRRGGTGRW